MRTVFRYVAVLSLALLGVIGFANHAVAQMEENEAYANVVVCSDPVCADAANTLGMGGATVTSLDAAGTVIDSCEVVTYPSGMDGCEIAKHAGDGSYSVTPTDEYAGYTLLSTEPVVHESMSHGTQLVWYYAPVADDAPVPAAPVTELPSTGVGSLAGGNPRVIFAIIPLALAVAAYIANKFARD